MDNTLTLSQRIHCEHLAHIVLRHYRGLKLDHLIAEFWRWLNLNKGYERKDELQFIIDILLDFHKPED